MMSPLLAAISPPLCIRFGHYVTRETPVIRQGGL